MNQKDVGPHASLGAGQLNKKVLRRISSGLQLSGSGTDIKGGGMYIRSLLLCLYGRLIKLKVTTISF